MSHFFGGAAGGFGGAGGNMFTSAAFMMDAPLRLTFMVGGQVCVLVLGRAGLFVSRQAVEHRHVGDDAHRWLPSTAHCHRQAWTAWQCSLLRLNINIITGSLDVVWGHSRSGTRPWQCTAQALLSPKPPWCPSADWSALCLNLQEACKGVRKPVDLSRLVGMQMPPVEVDIPPGLNTGQTIQVGHGSWEPVGAPCGGFVVEQCSGGRW